MSRRSNRGDDCAPAMFPFLAVLLCTIGALVLILVISVVNSHASAKREMDSELQDRVEKAQEQSDYLKSISDELSARREKVKQEIDRRRKELANVEDHILRLKAKMDQLRAQIESFDSSDRRDQMAQQQRQERIAALKEELEKRKLEIADEIEKSKNQKPAFSIIPYDGPNGTSRRPVYLECRADGVVIQPEGIRIGLQDLRPPYGPGNPIDAVLRVLRTAYQSRDTTFGLTIPPYPLLVVRPDGIHTYAMARAAMSGWDDQFGYELIDADMELVFPPGVPNLKDDLLSTLDAARKRQESVVASLSRQQTREREMDDIDFASLAPDSHKEQQNKLASQTSRGNVADDWKMIEEVADANMVSIGSAGAGGSAPQGTPISMRQISGTPGGSQFETSGGDSNGESGNSDEWSNPGGGSPGEGSSGATANASTSASNSPSPPSRANAFSSGSAAGNSFQSSSGTDSLATDDSQAMASAIKEMQSKEEPVHQNAVNHSQQSQSSSPSNQPSKDSSKSIASNRGKGWAMPEKDPKATPVTRPIRVVVLNDRWLIRKEGSETQFDAEIDLALGPQHASELLEKTIRNRVDSWGLSLPGGYWCPAIMVEHAVDAEQSVTRLRRLLDWSGVEIRTFPLQAPPSQTRPAQAPPSKRIPPRR